ncbi:MAG: hypothetical protein KGY61_08970 [Desulfobacterales bacterium]|nr:hypothetical protein [Desulfobacterales bacterium]
MFFSKLSFLNLGRNGKKPDTLPVDFGAMYYLYPSENQYSGFETISQVEKIVERVRSYFQKKANEDLKYYKTNFLY